jgi:hypothetical protein
MQRMAWLSTTRRRNFKVSGLRAELELTETEIAAEELKGAYLT